MTTETIPSATRTPIIIDTREPEDLTDCLRMLVTVDQIPVERHHLDSADYLLLDYFGSTLGIERKTPLDFVSSIADGRLESQLERMLMAYDSRLLVIHGTYRMTGDERLTAGNPRRDTRFRYSSFAAKMLSIQDKYAVRVLVVGTDQELAVVLRTLYRQGREGRFHL